MKSKYHKTKSGKMAKKGLWYNIQQKKKVKNKKPKMEPYKGKMIFANVDGKILSNQSYKKYYKGMI